MTDENTEHIDCNCEDCCYARNGEEICPTCGCLVSQCPDKGNIIIEK